ncbi:DUF6455 family protein [Mesorhizobium sp. KR9-304]|uniref:DUF6455 family protein n=1 Tax=Mesorhizobium sp. KR9-304 TaxID=3156614 RepID=UPI0032B393D9
MGSQRFRAAFERFVEKWRDYRAALADLREIEAMEPDTVAAVAAGCGLSVAELREVVADGSSATSLMARMMKAYGLDPEGLRARDPLTTRDIEVLCSRCVTKGHCRRELDAGTAADHADGFCPNAHTFERMVDAKAG